MKYFIYCRKSSERSDRQTLSIDAQLRELKKLVAKDKSIEIVDTFVESQSAYKPGRPVFNEMVERIDMGQAQGIIAWQANRLARNSLDGGNLIYMMDEGKLKEIRTRSKSFTGSGNDKFFLTIEFGMAKKSSDDTSDYMKRDARTKLLKGEWVGMAPIGYLNIDKLGKIAGKFYDHKKQTLLLDLERPLNRVEQDPIIAPLIRKFFDEYLKGDKSLNDMVQIVNGLGIKSPRYKCKYTCSMVERILKNPFFAGKMLYKGELFQGVHEPIITQKEFDYIQNRISERKRPQLVKQEFTYRGLIKCASCGCSIVGVRKTKPSGKVYEYYSCSKRRGACNQPTLKPNDIDNQVEEKIKAIEINERVWKLCNKLLKLYNKDQVKTQLKVRDNWEKDLRQVENKLDKLLDLHLSGNLEREIYSTKKNSLLNEKTELLEKLSDSAGSTDSHRERVEEFFDTAHAAYRIFKTGTLHQRKEIVKTIGWNLELLDGKLSWEYKKPFDFLAEKQTAMEMVGTPEYTAISTKNTPANAEMLFWRAGRDSNPRSSP